MLAIFLLLEVSMSSRPCLDAFLEAQLSSALFGGSKKRQVVFTNCREKSLILRKNAIRPDRPLLNLEIADLSGPWNLRARPTSLMAER